MYACVYVCMYVCMHMRIYIEENRYVYLIYIFKWATFFKMDVHIYIYIYI